MKGEGGKMSGEISYNKLFPGICASRRKKCQTQKEDAYLMKKEADDAASLLRPVCRIFSFF